MTTTTTNKSAAIAAIIDFFKENEDIFNECVESLDSYNGFLGDDRYYPMEELDELYNDTDPTEILARAFYGYDEDNNGAFNPTKDYFRFNAYGNLVSTDYIDYSGRLDEWAIKEMLENRGDVYGIDENEELSALFDALEDAVSEEE